MRNKLLPLLLLCSLLPLLLVVTWPASAAGSVNDINYVLQGTKVYYEPFEESFAGYFYTSSIVEIIDTIECDPELVWAEVKYLYDPEITLPVIQENENTGFRTVYIHADDVITSSPFDPCGANRIIPASACEEFNHTLLAELQEAPTPFVHVTTDIQDPSVIAGLRFIDENSPPYKCYYSSSGDFIQASKEASAVATRAFLYDYAGTGDAVNISDTLNNSDPFMFSYSQYLYSGAVKSANNPVSYATGPVSTEQTDPSADRIDSRVADENQPAQSTSSCLGTIRIYVIDAYTKAPLPGVSIVLHDPAGLSEDLKKKTGKDGVVEFPGTPSGTYEITQQTELKGYEACKLRYSVSTSDIAVYPVIFPNQPITGTVSVQITDKETSEPLPDCIFGLFSGKEQVFTLTTNASGIAEISNIPTGKYTLKSISLPDPYSSINQLSKRVTVRYKRKSEFHFSISADNTDFPDPKTSEKRGREIHLSILPCESSCLAQNGLNFGLFDVLCENGHCRIKNDSGAILTVFSDMRGNEVDVCLPTGTYCLAEADLNGQYVNPEHRVLFEINEETDSVELDPGQIAGYPVQLKTVSTDGQGLAGTYLHIFSEQTDLYRYTDDHGLLSETLFPGQYTVEVILSPDGYFNPSKPVYFDISDNGILSGKTQIQLEPCTFTISVRDTFGMPIEGAYLVLRNRKESHNEVRRSDANGNIAFDGIPFGEYVIEELYPSAGYLANITKIQLSLDGTCHEFNQPLCTLLSHMNSQTFLVTDPDGFAIPGMQFSLTDHTGSILETVVSDSDGLLHFSGVPSGSYSVEAVINDIRIDVRPAASTMTVNPETIKVSATTFMVVK